MNVDFSLPGYNFYFNETESSHGGIRFYISDKFTFKQSPDLLIDEPGRLESTFIDLILLTKKNFMCVCIFHPSLKISCFNSEYVTPLLANIRKERKTYMLMVDFNINLVNAETNINILEFYDNMSSHSFARYIFQPKKLTKSSETLIDNIVLNSIKFKTFSGNVTSLISDHLPQLFNTKRFSSQIYCNK